MADQQNIEQYWEETLKQGYDILNIYQPYPGKSKNLITSIANLKKTIDKLYQRRAANLSTRVNETESNENKQEQSNPQYDAAIQTFQNKLQVMSDLVIRAENNIKNLDPSDLMKPDSDLMHLMNDLGTLNQSIKGYYDQIKDTTSEKYRSEFTKLLTQTTHLQTLLINAYKESFKTHTP